MKPAHSIPTMCLSAWLLTALAGGARAQDASMPSATRTSLEMLEQGVEDVGPLATSQRVPPADLRVASDFEHVYRVPGNDSMLMRRDGALTAVFPRSEYLLTKDGSFAALPAGLTWVIGEPATGEAGAEASAGCGGPSHPCVEYGPAQQPFLMPGPSMPPRLTRARSATNDGPRVSTYALRPLAQPLASVPTATLEARIGASASPAPLAAHAGVVLTAPGGSSPAAAGSAMPALLTIESEMYRRVRLRAIAARLGPTADPAR